MNILILSNFFNFSSQISPTSIRQILFKATQKPEISKNFLAISQEFVSRSLTVFMVSRTIYAPIIKRSNKKHRENSPQNKHKHFGHVEISL
jgi:hypothetical protein